MFVLGEDSHNNRCYVALSDLYRLIQCHLFVEAVGWFTQKSSAVKLVISTAKANEILLNDRHVS